MQRAAVAVVLFALTLGACGDDDQAAAPASQEDALAIAEEATEAVADLEQRADELAHDLDRMGAARRNLAEKFNRIHADLRDSIADLRGSLSDVTSDASSARESARQALAEIDSAMKRLAVLESRFDYHLRREH